MRQLLAMIFLTVLVGCVGPSHDLEDRWSPLVRVKQTTDRLMEDGVSTTIGDTVYTNDLKGWLATYPPGSVEYEAILLHEQTHSIRENSFPGGVGAWIVAYAVDRDFRWREEQEGWKKEIVHLVRHGRYVNPVACATVLNQGYDFQGRMVSFEVALAWVNAVIAEAQSGPR